MNRLQGKVVLVTGASSGIGMACARAFAAYGVKLILVARREDALNQLQSELAQQFGTKIYTQVLDVRDRQAVDSFFAALPREFASIDILINNAGLALGMAHTANSSIDDWENMISTNITGLLYITKATLAIMYAEERGHIINLGSIAGVMHYANASVYCATKAAVHAFSSALRQECVEKNIKISEVLPGLVNTEFSTVRFHGDKTRADSVYDKIEPLTAEDIADLVIYVANLPAHVNLAESLIMPSCQASPTLVKRKS